MTGRLAGRHILVVEDDYFIATDLKRALEKEGATVLGPAGRLEDGAALVEAERIDVAVLDVNLGGPTTYPLADRLAVRGVPCMFVTGYDTWSMRAPYCDAPRVSKPFSTRAIMDAITSLLRPEEA